MATLILTTVGTAIGGPIGGALGALIGQSLDARLLAPKGRQGARLSDLRIQTSSYGTQVPRLYGGMRVAGTVIWATDLIEHRTKQSGGKGRGSTTSYSYSASFAVALSSRPIVNVRRIWAEGNVLRGAAGDFKSATGFRLYTGDEDQAVDPLLAAAEGVGACPAYRGLAYVVFEDMDLSPFGNRIPSLSFEVEADDAPITLADPLADLLGAVATAAAMPALTGLAVGGDSRRDAIEPLARLTVIDQYPGAALWRLGEGSNDPVMLLREPADDRGAARGVHQTGGAGTVPRHIAVAHYDPERDYQSGVQQARVAGGSGVAEAVGMPVALMAGDAKALAMRLAREAVQVARRTEWPAGFAALAAPPGSRVRAGAAAIGRVAERSIEGSVVRLVIESERLGSANVAAADGGRVLGSPDVMIGESRGWLFDLPLIDGVTNGSARLVLVAGGTGAGWRRAAVSLNASAGALPAELGQVTAMAVLGQVVGVEGAGQAWLFDRAGAIIVELLHDDMLLTNADDAALIGGANLAVAGGELLQFGHAAPLGNRQWRLTQLLRGRFGSDDAMAGLVAGQGFALIDDPALMVLPMQAQVGGTISLMGQGDAVSVALPITAAGRASRPLAPVGLTWRWRDDGGADLNWARRSRTGFGWADYVDAPIDERDERYQIGLGDGASAQLIETSTPGWPLSAADLAAWRAIGPNLTVRITQWGEAGPSPALVRAFAL